jgi:hypothetical protein
MHGYARLHNTTIRKRANDKSTSNTLSKYSRLTSRTIQHNRKPSMTSTGQTTSRNIYQNYVTALFGILTMSCSKQKNLRLVDICITLHFFFEMALDTCICTIHNQAVLNRIDPTGPVLVDRILASSSHFEYAILTIQRLRMSYVLRFPHPRFQTLRMATVSSFQDEALSVVLERFTTANEDILSATPNPTTKPTPMQVHFAILSLITLWDVCNPFTMATKAR